MLGALKSPLGVAGGLLLAEKVGGMVQQRGWFGGASSTAFNRFGVPGLIGVAGYLLAKKGGLVGNLGQGAIVNSVVHIAGGFMSSLDTNFGSY